MSIELRPDRVATLNALTHFYDRMLNRIHDFDVSLSTVPGWTVHRFVNECINSSTARFGEEAKLRNSQQSLEMLTEQFEGSIMYHGLRGALNHTLQSLRQDLLNDPVEDALLYFEHTREMAARIAWNWYCEGKGNINDSQASQTSIHIYAGNERKIFTIPSLAPGGVQIAFQFNPADFPFEFYLSFPVYLVHEYLSHVYRYEFFGGTFECSSHIFEDGWLYFVAFRLVERNLNANTAHQINKEFKTWYFEYLERQVEIDTSDVGLGFGTAKKLASVIGRELFNLISTTAARCPDIYKDKKFHADLVLSVHHAFKDAGYENRKLKQTLADKMQEAGKILFDQGRFEEGRHALELAAKLHPELTDTYLATLGHLYLGSRNFEDAHDAFVRSLEKNSRNWVSLLGESVIESIKGNPQRALEMIGEGLLLNPYQKQLWNQKGVVLMQIGQVEQALVAIDRALDIDEHYLGALRNKLQILNNLDLFDQARSIQITIETIEQQVLSQKK
ncbi:MAG TPA: hypothetical protein VF658_20960 [Pyrinomonadaceae bacterium]|jgi:tetratricopeptide (TPR) repeat protein